MISKDDFRARLKKFGLETSQNIKSEQADALWERFKHYDQAPVWQAIEAMTYDGIRLELKTLREAIKARVSKKENSQPTEINIETWPAEQRLRIKALSEAIQKGPEAIKKLKEAQDKGEGIWDFSNEKLADRYDCHENCDKGTVFYQDKDGNSYAGTCAICKKGPGKPSPLINPDNLQIIKQGQLRQGG